MIVIWCSTLRLRLRWFLRCGLRAWNVMEVLREE
jgi:hypothetical protein